MLKAPFSGGATLWASFLEGSCAAWGVVVVVVVLVLATAVGVGAGAEGEK
jgi:hypothetical protein